MTRASRRRVLVGLVAAILREITELRPHPDGTNVHSFDDPDMLRFPIAYLSKPGYWFPDDGEVLGLRHEAYKFMVNYLIYGLTH